MDILKISILNSTRMVITMLRLLSLLFSDYMQYILFARKSELKHKHYNVRNATVLECNYNNSRIL